jgi:DNA-3-methyladenine glycosylase
MFLAPGHAYVYIAYGCWPVLNVASEEEGIGAGVLIRALESIEGVDEMRRTRPGDRLIDLARGPGRLAAAMRVTMAHDGCDLCGGGPLWLGSPLGERRPLAAAPRIGITKEADRQLRFFERGSPFVSGPRRLLAG